MSGRSIDAAVDTFVRTGWVAIPEALDRSFCERRVAEALARMSVDESDRSTWPTGWHNTAPTAAPPIEEVAPIAAEVLGTLIGGLEAASFSGVPDNLIFNFPDDSSAWWPPEDWSNAGAGYHKDGDFFRHFLDSPEQGILGIILWRDVTERQGPTYFAIDSIGPVAQHLEDHPEGVDPADYPMNDLLARCHDFRPLVGEQGTVVFAHPFMLHSSSVNATDRIRVISNTAVMLREPMRLDREDGCSTPVEQVTLAALGVDRLSFSPTRDRAKRTSAREEQWKAEGSS